MYPALVFLTMLAVVLRVSAVCPDGWVGIGYNQECQVGGDEDDCTGSFGTIYANDCDYIAMSNNGGGDWCAGTYDSGAAVYCEGGPDSQPYWVVTSGGYFGNCQPADAYDQQACFSFWINNPIYWCCGPS